jgi:hypothetical protein
VNIVVHTTSNGWLNLGLVNIVSVIHAGGIFMSMNNYTLFLPYILTISTLSSTMIVSNYLYKTSVWYYGGDV